MKLTIVTATFNDVKAGRQEMLHRCISSVSSIKTPHEHLIFDGGSKDGTVEILEKLQSKYVWLKVVSEPDKGIFDALNKGLKAAKGEWFMVIGDDDYISHVDELDRVMDNIDDWGYDFVSAPIECSDGSVVRAAPRMTMCNMPQAHVGMLLKTDLFRKLGGFDLRYRIAGDYDMTFKLHLQGTPCKILPNPFVFFSLTGLSSTSKTKTAEEVASIASEHLGLNAKWHDRLRDTRIVPLGVCLKYLTHPSVFLREAAKHQFKRWCLWRVGLMDSNGVPKIGR